MPADRGSERVLDNAIDNYAASGFLEISGYDTYLEEVFWPNRMSEALKSGWDEHYARINRSTMHALVRVINEGVRLQDLNLLYMGPGFHPVDNEIHRDVVDVFLKHVNSIILCDISQKVVKAARNALVEAGVPSKKILLAQYDISDGLGTVYNDIIDEELKNVTTEDELDKMSMKMEKLTMDQIRGKLLEVMKKRRVVSVPNIIGGGINDERTLSFTVNGARLPIHLALYQMVFAGTGAAAEGKIWDRFSEVTSDPERGARSGDQRFNRSRIRARFYRAVQRFNTAISTRHIRKLFRDNDDAPPRLVQAFTDVNTTYDHDEGELARLNVEQLSWDLAEPPAPEEPEERPNRPIATTIRARDFWKDEVDHGHGTLVMQFVLGDNGNGTTKMSLPLVQSAPQRPLPPPAAA